MDKIRASFRRFDAWAAEKYPSLRKIVRDLVRIDFVLLHYTYFIGVSILVAIIFWGSSTPARSVSFTDSLFLVVSAITGAGLNTVNLSTLNTFQQFLLFLMIMIGSPILVSLVVVHVRREAFKRRFEIEQYKPKNTSDADSVAVGSDWLSMRSPLSAMFQPFRRRRASTMDENTQVPSTPEANDFGVAAVRTMTPTDCAIEDTPSPSPVRENGIEMDLATRVQTEAPNAENEPFPDHIRFAPEQANRDIIKAETPNISTKTSELWGPWSDSLNRRLMRLGIIGRNSKFVNLTYEERQRLGGVEYAALSWLRYIVLAYYILWLLLGSIGIGWWMANYAADTTQENGLNPWWTGAFNAISAFCNSGMSLLDANMLAFQDAYYVIVTMSLMILAGNTCYPIFLRLIIWTIWYLIPSTPRLAHHKATLRFLLDHPRRCYTTLFPSQHTWYLLGTLVVLNGVDWAAFEVLNYDNSVVTDLAPAARVLDGLFQAFAVRSGGFYIAPIANLSIGLLVLYVIMMYISVYPVTISLRNSNVYEEKSLGIFPDEDPNAAPAPDVENATPSRGIRRRNSVGSLKEFRRRTMSAVSKLTDRASNTTSSYFVRQQLRGQLAHDIYFLCLAIFLITTIESSSFNVDPVTFSTFNIIFETVSAYGCVGISVGVPYAAYSFCGAWHVTSKLILCVVMLRGRHRGLPVAIDKAVMLPKDLKDEHGHSKEKERSRHDLSRPLFRRRKEN